MTAKTRLLMSAMILLLACWSAHAATYYVNNQHPRASDSNPGTQASPWLTIQHAADTVQYGDTVIVQTGTYPERVSWNSTPSGIPSKKIVFRAEPRRTVLVGGTDIQGGFDTYHVDYLRIEGFEIRHTTAAVTRYAIVIRSHQVEVVDNYIHDTNVYAIGSNYISTGTPPTYALVENNEAYLVQSGILVAGHYWTVQGNIVHRLKDYGNGDCDYSRFFGTFNVLRANTFYGSSKSETLDAHVDCFQTFNTRGGKLTHYITIEGNWCQDSHQCVIASTAVIGEVTHITVRNNVCYGNWVSGVNSIKVQDWYIGNNMFVNTGSQGYRQQAYTTGRVINNIFYNNRSEHPNWSGYQWPREGSTSVLYKAHHNLSYSTEKTFIADDYPGDIVNQHPQFVSVARLDFHLQAGSPARDAGVDLSATGFANDFDGTSRPQGTAWDIGAYER